jgi:hypothetical protein
VGTDSTYRFGVGDLHSARSAIWRLWATSKDFYLGVRSKAGLFKISFHESGVCQIAVTSQFAEEVSEQLKSSEQGRSINRWRRPVAPADESILYYILFPQFCLRLEPLNLEDASKVAWHSQPGEGNMRTFILSIQRTDTLTKKVSQPLLTWHLSTGETLRLYTSVEPPPAYLLSEYEKVCNEIRAIYPVKLGAGKLPEDGNRMALFMTRHDGIKFAVDVAVDVAYNENNELE